jgi:hydroxyethylthiazole kinase
MADAIDEAEDIAAIANAVVLNMGTLNERTIPSMIAAGKSANTKGIPVVFDPVGAGASKLRNDTAAKIISEINLSVLRGNISEIKFIAGLRSETKGVDASEGDITEKDYAGQIAKGLAKRIGCTVVISGAVDIVSDGEKIIYIENGHPMLGNLSGTGCMCSSLIGSLCGASPEKPFEAAVAAMICMGIAGEIAHERTRHEFPDELNRQGSFHRALRDFFSSLEDAHEIFNKRAKYYEA